MTTEPTDDDLRGFVLGTLPADRAPDVQRWLDADPARADRLEQLAGRDALTEAVVRGADRRPVPTSSVERVARGVAESLRTTPDADTPSGTGHGGTVMQPRPPVIEVPVAWPPARLGQFRVVRELGHGGMGYVFEAEDELIGRRVAVKVLTPELARRPDAAARFLREARAAAKVEHENVVPVLHVGDDGGVPYIVMPLLKGESLADRIKREKKLPTEAVIRIGRDVAAGLGAAHARGLVHRDMKPANVWLDTDGRARVLDFGLARLTDGADALTDSRALMGTPAYMAPEQLDGKPATPQSDLFGLGAVLYECVTGAKAFDGPSLTAILNAVNACRPKPLAELNPDAPPSLAALIERLLKKNPTGRPAEAREVIAALVLRPGDAGSDLGTAPWIDPERRVRLRSRKSAWLVGGLALAALAALAAAGVYFGTRPRQPEAVQESPKGNTEPTAPAPKPDPKPGPTRYTGKVDVLVERVVAGKPKLLRLDQDGALPLNANDRFRIEGEVKPPAYLYLVWVDPDRDVTPAYPWNPEADRWQGTRPAVEEVTDKVSLPRNTGDRWRAPTAKPGVATMVLFARPTPLDVSDDAVERWFKELPDLPLPPGGDGAAMWFDNYAVVATDPARRAGFVREESNDPFRQWQGQLQKSIGEKASFQTAVSFARTGRK